MASREDALRADAGAMRDVEAMGDPTSAGAGVFDFGCPHCSGRIQIQVAQIGAHGPTPPMTPAERAQMWRDTAPQAVRDFLNVAEKSGVFDSFRSALQQLPIEGRTKNPWRFFFTVLEKAVPLKLAPEILRRLTREWPGQIAVFQANGVVLVTSSGVLKAFGPVSVFKEIATPQTARVDFSGEWMRTKFGYVTTPLMFDEYRRRAIGLWDTVTSARSEIGWQARRVAP